MTQPMVAVLDYGSGNLRSAERALIRAGARVVVTPSPERAAAADGLVVPGVGAYAACMAGVHAIGAAQMITERVAAGGPTLGICVGMQILFERGEEHGLVTEGIGLLPGAVTRLAADRVPHMGWNTVRPAAGTRLFTGLGTSTRFYFVHSYAAHPAHPAGTAHPAHPAGTAHPAHPAGTAHPAHPAGTAHPAHPAGTTDRAETADALITTTDHGDEFVSAVERGPLAATQFHPEKSGDAGATLLRNWVATL